MDRLVDKDFIDILGNELYESMDRISSEELGINASKNIQINALIDRVLARGTFAEGGEFIAIKIDVFDEGMNKITTVEEFVFQKYITEQAKSIYQKQAKVHSLEREGDSILSLEEGSDVIDEDLSLLKRLINGDTVEVERYKHKINGLNPSRNRDSLKRVIAVGYPNFLKEKTMVILRKAQMF